VDRHVTCICKHSIIHCLLLVTVHALIIIAFDDPVKKKPYSTLGYYRVIKRFYLLDYAKINQITAETANNSINANITTVLISIL